MTTYRVDLANFTPTGENAAGILATTDAEVGNLPVSDCLLIRGENDTTLLTCPARLSEPAMRALHATVEWAWREAVAAHG